MIVSSLFGSEKYKNTASWVKTRAPIGKRSNTAFSEIPVGMPDLFLIGIWFIPHHPVYIYDQKVCVYVDGV